MSPTLRDEPPAELDLVRDGRLPARYEVPIARQFIDCMRAALEPDVRILDVGAGHSPTLSVEERPPGCHYVGLDISRQELEAAASYAYDEVIVHDVTRPLTGKEPFDVVLSWQVFEHVRPLDAALENLRQILRPGGTLIAQLSGTFAVFAVGARAMPHRLRVRAMEQALGMVGEDKFPTHYDRCHARALKQMLEPWSTRSVTPLFRGAGYFSFSSGLQRLYVAYESVVARRPISQLATHYLVTATR
jgi:SAM-dependent methyltransferase